jgi:hypothetical protein
MRANFLNWSSRAALCEADAPLPAHSHDSAPAMRRNVTELPSTTSMRVCLHDAAGGSPSTAAAESDSFAIAVPNFLEEEEIAGVRLVPLLLRFREQSMRIFNALLAEKRVLFLGHHQPAALVCNFVLGACLMVSPPLVGCLQRAHPYATLTNMEFLKTPGYIAGVTNPIFESHTGWWDVCANMSTGEIHLSPAYAKQLAAQSEQESEAAAMAAEADERAKPTAADLDRVFIAHVLSAIESGTAGVSVGGSVRDDEAWTRCQFRDYTQRLVSMAYGEEEFASDAEHVVALEANAARINAWKRTRSFATAHSKRKAQRHGATLSEAAAGALAQRVRQLQARRAMGADELRATLEGIEHALTPPAAVRGSATSAAAAAALVCEFLPSVSDSQGGLAPIAEHLLHADASVRAAALRVLTRIDSVAEGAAFVCNLNYLYLMAYQRAAQAAAEADVGAQDRL